MIGLEARHVLDRIIAQIVIIAHTIVQTVTTIVHAIAAIIPTIGATSGSISFSGPPDIVDIAGHLRHIVFIGQATTPTPTIVRAPHAIVS